MVGRVMRLVLLVSTMILMSFNPVYAKQNVFHEVKTIKVGSCTLDVYTATTDFQKMTGMLVFDDNTFDQDGMLFVGNKMRQHHYHTINMKMDIMIMGVKTIGSGEYVVYDKVKYSPPGLERVDIVGDSVLEIPTTLYNNKFKQCLTN